MREREVDESCLKLMINPYFLYLSFFFFSFSLLSSLNGLDGGHTIICGQLREDFPL